MKLSERTIGLLIGFAGNSTQAKLGPLLMTHGLSAGDPGIDLGFSTEKRANLALLAGMKNKQEAELLSLAVTALRDQSEDDSSPE